MGEWAAGAGARSRNYTGDRAGTARTGSRNREEIEGRRATRRGKRKERRTGRKKEPGRGDRPAQQMEKRMETRVVGRQVTRTEK
jgi:hypothetical protein